MFNHLQYYVHFIFFKQFLIKYNYNLSFLKEDFFVFFPYKKKNLLLSFLCFFLFFDFIPKVLNNTKTLVILDIMRVYTIFSYFTPKHGYSKIFVNSDYFFNSLWINDFSHSVYNPYFFNIMTFRGFFLKLMVERPFW